MTRRDLIRLAGTTGRTIALTPLARATSLGAQATADSWGKDKLIRLSLRPPDYETPVALLDTFITPVEHFFVRSHLPVPAPLDAAAWTLRIDGEVDAPLTLTLADVRALPVVTITMTLECAGNGRGFFDPPVAGLQWRKGAVGTARFTGARLIDILLRARVRPSARVVHMQGADRPLGKMPPFVRQLPLDKAMHPDTLVAYEMNGQPLTPVHGFPLRTIVPGWEGAYSMKWLRSLHVSAVESDSFWVATAYRYPVRRVAPGAAVDPKDTAPLTGLIVKSLITTPLDGATLPPGRIAVGGFAWAGATAITVVDVSLDHGATWRRASLVGEQAPYAWRRFEFAFEATRPESHLILSRATDASGTVQPAVSHWNPAGYLWNQHDSVRVEVKG
jgi:DMSO/TMAO reductase YedYZ molybdopterin-dependent catalytic subunit